MGVNMTKIKRLFYLFFPIIVGGLVGFIISGNIDYNELVKPLLSPPKILFPIMWSIIYLLMGVSYYLLKRKDNNLDLESKVYYIQLFVNALWSIIFFLLKWRFVSVLWILLLDCLVIFMVYLFYKKIKVSGYLNLLYLCWVLFATYLTIGIYLLN